MIRENKGGIPLLRFASLQKLGGVIHGVTTREGGVSRPPFAGLNLARGEDDSSAVQENLGLVQEALGLERLAWARQIHGKRIVTVSGSQGGEVDRADGLATDQPGVGLLIKQADCQALILVEPEAGVIANLHVGWRGNVADMPGRGVDFLGEQYGVKAHNLVAAVSPSLGPCCSEFVNHAEELGPDFAAYLTRADHFDLWRATRDQLMRAGVAASRIELSGLCTRCHGEFFSYRRKKTTGRFGTIVALRHE